MQAVSKDECLSRAAFGRLVKLADARVRRLIADGMPAEGTKIPVAKAQAWMAAHVDTSRRNAWQGAKEGESLNDFRRQREAQKVQQGEIEIAKARGELVERAAVKKFIADRARMERDQWIAWSSAVAGRLAAGLGVDAGRLFGALEGEKCGNSFCGCLSRPWRNETMAAKKDPIAIVALCISIVTAVFSVYQWWNNEKESRVNAAIEISRNNLKDRDERTMAAVVKIITGNEISLEDAMLISLHADQLEYIAFLANANKLDKSYLSVALNCDIVLTLLAGDKLAKLFPPLAKSPAHQMRDFDRTANCDLNTMFPGLLPPKSN
jgi:hypothetical protein